MNGKMRKVSIRTVENTIGLARSVADGTTKFPFMGYCADLMEKMLEDIKEQQAEIEGLKMGFAGNGTSDSELAEVRAQANRWFLKIKEQQDRIGVLEANYKIQLNILKKQRDYIDQLEKGLESSIAMNKAQAERQVKELTDEEIRTIQAICHLKDVGYDNFIMRFARAILRKAQEK